MDAPQDSACWDVGQAMTDTFWYCYTEAFSLLSPIFQDIQANGLPLMGENLLLHPLVQFSILRNKFMAYDVLPVEDFQQYLLFQKILLEE
jgi:hypothetical protein